MHMRPTATVFVATSLDGFIDWLLQANNLVPAGEDCGYQEFMANVDALVADVALSHVETRSCPFGFVQSRYRVQRTA